MDLCGWDLCHGLVHKALHRRRIKRADVPEGNEGDVVALADHHKALVHVNALNGKSRIVGGTLIAVSG